MADRDGIVPPGKAIGILQGFIGQGKPYEYFIVPGVGLGILILGEPGRQYWKAVDAWLARVTKR